MAKPKLVTHAGYTGSIGAWARRLGLKRSTVSHRLRRGWPLLFALSPGYISRKQVRMFR